VATFDHSDIRGLVIFVVTYEEYVYLVPSVEESEYYFLKIIIPSRKAKRDYLTRGNL
jgi:hypothetical protein